MTASGRASKRSVDALMSKGESKFPRENWRSRELGQNSDDSRDRGMFCLIFVSRRILVSFSMSDATQGVKTEGGGGGGGAGHHAKPARAYSDAGSAGRSVSSATTAPEWLSLAISQEPDGGEEKEGSASEAAPSRTLKKLSPALDRAVADAVDADPRSLGENLVCLAAEVRRLMELNTRDVSAAGADPVSLRRSGSGAARASPTACLTPADPQIERLQGAYVSYETLRQRLLPLEEGAKEQLGLSEANQLLQSAVASYTLPEEQRRLCGNLLYVVMEHCNIQSALQRCVASSPRTRIFRSPRMCDPRRLRSRQSP